MGGLLDVGGVKSLTLSAEHATIELTPLRPAPGVGETVFLHDQICGSRSGRLEMIWPILGRDKTQ